MAAVSSKKYDPEVLHRVQQYELEILRDFIAVCGENGFSYFGFSGTGIGALRHGGFIPWDDDIDVAILRDDYEKLIEIFKTRYADKYEILSAETSEYYPLATTRIMLKGSRFVEEPFKKLKCPLGIFLDVYPLDKIAADPKKKRRQQVHAWILSKILILKHIPFPVLQMSGWKVRVIHAVTAVIWFFLNLFGISHQFLYRRIMRVCRRYDGEESEEYGYLCASSIGVAEFSKTDIFPLRKIPFEGMEMAFPNRLEAHLEKLYGDYMQLPPPEKRANHIPYLLEFPKEDKN